MTTLQNPSKGFSPSKTQRVQAAAWGLGLPLTSLLSLHAPAVAQTADAPALQEVVITAEKRSSSVQKTPISITAVTGASLQEKGIAGVKALAAEVPGVATKSGGPGQTEFTIRGMSSSAGVAPTVGFYLDETPVTPPTIATAGKVGIDPDLYDLARVEILRGPQGTLYGASSMGGTIKLVTAAPKLGITEGSVQVIGSNTEGGGLNGTVNAMVNVPLNKDSLALRVVASRKRNSGWIDRVVESAFPVPDTSGTGSYFTAPRGDVVNTPATRVYKRTNTEDVNGLRAALLFKPTSSLTITPSVFTQRIKQGGPDTYDSNSGTNAHYQPFDQAETFRDQFSIYNVKVEYEFDTVSLLSATSYSKRDRRQVQDSSELLQKTLGDFGISAYDPASGGIGAATMVESQPTRQFSQELRLASKSGGPLQWIAGVFFSRFRSSYDAVSIAPDAAPVLGDTNIYSATLSDTLVQKALFGNASYVFTPSLKATAGLRYFTSNDQATNHDSGLFSSGVSEPSTASAKGLNPMLNLAYTVNSDAMLYTTAAKGFRDGAAQHGVPVSCAADLAAFGLSQSPTRFGPDTVWSYEVGSKNRFFNRKLTVNGAMYYQKWSKVQQTVSLPTCGFTYTDNSADASVSGFELEALARLAGGFSIEQGVGYAHARFVSSDVKTGTQKGDKLLNVPAWTSSTSLRLERPINDDYSFVSRLGVSYTGASDSLTDSRKTLPAYTLVNFRAGVQAADWTASLFVDNLTNRRVAYSNTASLTVNVPYLDRVATNRPRTIGIDFSRKF